MDGAMDAPWSDSNAPPDVAAANATMPASTLPMMSSQAQLILEIVMVLMCLGAVTGNILVIVIVVANKTLHTVTSVLIMNLAVSDLLVGIGVMPFVAVSVLSSAWGQCTDLCLYVGYTSSVYCTASVLTLAAIALDRYYSIVDCLRYTSRCTLWRTCLVVLWIWLQALATSCPPLLGWSSISYMAPMFSCAVNWPSSPTYTAFMLALSYLLPAVVILYCYVNIVKVARSHARRIHTLEEYLQRSRMNCGSIRVAEDSSARRLESPHHPSTLIYHISGQFVSEGNSKRRISVKSTAGGCPSIPTSRRFLPFLTPNDTHSGTHNSQQHPHHHGVWRLFLIISAFFLCWTPYVGVALVQATETAISGQSSLVPSTAVTFSYWLVLLNSDINPLLYALLSKRFQGALESINQKLRARLLSFMGRAEEIRADGEDGRSTDLSTQITPCPGPPPTSLSSSSADSKCCSSIFTANTDLHVHAEGLCRVCQRGRASPSSFLWQDSNGERVEDSLQVPCRPHDGNRLPFSALTESRQATFFYGQITVRVEHDVC